MKKFCKNITYFCSILLLIQLVPFSYHYSYAAEVNKPVDEKMVNSFQSHKPNFMSLGNTNTEMPPSDPPEVGQEFSFVAKTFRTVATQPVIVQFTSRLATNEVIVRIPENGKIMEEFFSNGESIQHFYGEYWFIQTEGDQTNFELPVVFNEPGNYFLTIDQDADHFYLEVDEAVQEIENEINQSSEEYDVSDENQEPNNEQRENKTRNSNAIQPVKATEKHLTISSEVVRSEEERILEETLDIATRRSSSVSNWSQFRSAWNDSRTTEIVLTSNVSYSSSILGSSLNTRNSYIGISSGNNHIINFRGNESQTTNNLEMSGTANLHITGITLSPGVSTIPIIKHNGSGLVRCNGIEASFNGNGTIIEAQNIDLRGRIELRAVQSSYSAISVVRGGTLSITPNSQRGFISAGTNLNNSKPIRSDATSKIILNTNRLTMADGFSTSISNGTSWFKVNATLTGVNGSQVVDSDSDPNDFKDRYTENFNTTWYNTLVFNGSGSGFEPPIQLGTVTANYIDISGKELAPSESLTGNIGASYETAEKEIDGWTLTELPLNVIGVFTQEPITVNYIYKQTEHPLSFQVSPLTGGEPAADKDLLVNGESTTIHANPNEGYRFVSWEILSGKDVRIEDENSEVIMFTMGNSGAVIRAVYEKQTFIVNPLDPLDPEKEVSPENPPQLPNDQGLFSIDFVSQFSFGEQGISTRLMHYHANPQNLLDAEGTVIENEERPNYVQISDRRAENERHGWVLAVTQNSQFKNSQNHELSGARLHLSNQQFASTQNGNEPQLTHKEGVVLIPEQKTELLTANEDQGTGTWIYRFGDGSSAGESVTLEVPETAAPKATTYQTTLTWELSAVPENK
ncbi:WxL domain-containing protein [Enterococcus sp. NPDC086594]|uniref:WxL domain-containing protein n=1 Tax=Enterococcus sp. NPDC086594 TaxID=3363992 RepID=UPI0038072392